MGVGFPIVGYVAATSHGGSRTSKVNLKKRAEVDTFMGMARIAFLEGWADGLFPSGVTMKTISDGLEIPEKNFEHRIFFDSDLERRPELIKAIDFLKSEPAGGSLCVISVKDIAPPSGPEFEFNNKNNMNDVSRRLRSLEQCYAIHALEEIPIVECGRRTDSTSAVYNFARVPSRSNDCEVKSKMVSDLISKALAQQHSQGKRIENSSESCVLGRPDVLSRVEKQDLVRSLDRDLVCDKCKAELREPIRAPRMPV